MTELIAAGREKLSTVPSGGGAVAVAVAAPAAGAPAAAAEAKKEEKEESDEEVCCQPDAYAISYAPELIICFFCRIWCSVSSTTNKKKFCFSFRCCLNDSHFAHSICVTYYYYFVLDFNCFESCHLLHTNIVVSFFELRCLFVFNYHLICRL